MGKKIILKRGNKMKKMLLKFNIFIIILVIITISCVAYAYSGNGEITVYLNNEKLTFEKYPITENDRTLVPMRTIFEVLEAEVAWDNDTNTATAIKDGATISITIDSDVMYKNGEAVQLDAPARLIDDGYTFVPLRAVSEALDCDVQWNEDLQRVDITTK